MNWTELNWVELANDTTIFKNQKNLNFTVDGVANAIQNVINTSLFLSLCCCRCHRRRRTVVPFQQNELFGCVSVCVTEWCVCVCRWHMYVFSFFFDITARSSLDDYHREAKKWQVGKLEANTTEIHTHTYTYTRKIHQKRCKLHIVAIEKEEEEQQTANGKRRRQKQWSE